MGSALVRCWGLGVPSATGTLIETATSAGGNTFEITLQNTGLVSIGSFWFAWIPGQDYLPSQPSTVTPPTGWTDSVFPGPHGYSIQFNTNTNLLTAGTSLPGFVFQSADALSDLMGDASSYPGTPVTTSEVNTASGFGGTSSSSFVVAVVPEPGTNGVAVMGMCGMLYLVRRRRGMRAIS